jgi:hypothetical protein
MKHGHDGLQGTKTTKVAVPEIVSDACMITPSATSLDIKVGIGSMSSSRSLVLVLLLRFILIRPLSFVFQHVSLAPIGCIPSTSHLHRPSRSTDSIGCFAGQSQLAPPTWHQEV